MELLNKSKNLDEKEFIIRLENGYMLEVRYSYEKDKKTFLLFYILQRVKSNMYPYALTILEGIEDADFQWGYCTERESKIQFQSIKKALDYLKRKEEFKIEDWSYSKAGKKDFEKDKSVK
jgi:hypothetical protein